MSNYGSTLKLELAEEYNTLILHDDCIGGSGTVAGRAPTPVQPSTSTWAVDVGAVATNGSGKFAATNVSIASIDTTVATGLYTAKFNVDEIATFYVRGGTVPNDDFFRIVFRNDTYGQTIQGAYIQKRTGGGTVLTIAAGNSGPLTLPSIGTQVTVQIEITSTSIRFQIIGYYDYTLVDSALNTNTKIVVGSLASSGVTLIDDIKVLS